MQIFLSVFGIFVSILAFATATNCCHYLGFSNCNEILSVFAISPICNKFFCSKFVLGFLSTNHRLSVFGIFVSIWDFATATNCCHYLGFSNCNEILSVFGISPICNKFFCSKFFFRFSVNKNCLSEFVILQNSNELL